MNSNSFILYLWTEANSKLTLISKIILGVFIISLFIPAPSDTIASSTSITILLSLYIALIMAFAMFGAVFLAYKYIDFKSDVDSDQNYILYLYLFLVLTPIVSLLIYYGFHIITAIQVALFAPTIMAILIIIVDKLANITVNIDKIKKIFIKK